MGTNDKLGTTDMGSKVKRKKDGKPDFDAELKELEAELRALGLKK